MPLFTNPRLALATEVSQAVRHIRTLPIGSREKKDMLRQWYDEQEMLRRAQRGGVRPLQVVRSLLGGIFGRGPGVIDRLRQFEQTNFAAREELTREMKQRGYDALLGQHLNSRLRG